MFKFSGFNRFSVAAVLLSLGAFASVAYANHSWGGYHWARTATPFTLKLGDNVSGAWDANLATASSDWSVSSVLDTMITLGKTDPRKCRPTAGRVEVCDSRYGNNGWLGIASIWANGSHITQGTVKVNDTYFNTSTYNTPAWKNLVLCQEIGHTFGLGHQDEDFYNAPLGTCMDYTIDPTPNQHPNQHDYDMLQTIYAHLDAFMTAFTSKASSASAIDDIDTSNPAERGKVIRKSRDGRSSLHERDLGNGKKVFTFIIWANEAVTE